MLRLTLYEAASAGPALDDLLAAIINVAYERPAPTLFQSGGYISLAPGNPYPRTHDVTATYRGTGLEYTKNSFPITISGHTSDFSTWNFSTGMIASIAVRLDGRLAFTEEFTPSYHADRLPPGIGPFSLGVTFTGNGHDNEFTGGPVRDILHGLGGDDVLSGMGGNDALGGGPGSDHLDGGPGADVLAGGPGNDIYAVDNAGDRVIEAAGQGIDGVMSSVSWALPTAVERLTLTGNRGIQGIGNAAANVIVGNDGDNRLIGNGGDDLLSGGAGDDEVRGGAGDDVAIGGAGGDSLYGIAGNDDLRGGDGDDALHGGAGNDSLAGQGGADALGGEAGNDRLYGGPGRDLLVGGPGADLLVGGSDADVFRFSAVADIGYGRARDAIADMASGDRIDLSRIDADTLATGDQAFSFIGSTWFSGAPGEIRFANHILSGDIDGDGVADFTLTVLGTARLSTADLIL